MIEHEKYRKLKDKYDKYFSEKPGNKNAKNKKKLKKG